MNHPTLEQRETLVERPGSSKKGFADFSHAFAGVSALISVLQGIIFVLEGSWEYYNVTGVVPAIATAIFAGKYLAVRAVWLFWLVSFLLLVECGLFVANLVATVPPFPLRLLQVGIFTLYVAILIATLLTATKLIAPAHAFLVACSTGVGLFIVEAVQELPQFSEQTASDYAVDWSVRFQSHPVLGALYVPYSTIKTYYPGNPRGYFKIADGRESQWQLQVKEGNLADVIFPTTEPGMLRIEINEAETKDPWHIQLTQDRLSIRRNQSYSLVFKARADSPRRVAAAVSQAHKPWDNVGLYSGIELTTEWQSFNLEFVAMADDDNARIQFDFGGSSVPVELSGITLLRLPSGETIKPASKEKYFVSYRVNGLGCRGPDYPIPRSGNTGRILFLGDSFTMGVGVHEEDTFAHRLEHLLNESHNGSRAGTPYEVISCGQSGFSTRDERLFYETFASQYEPDVVVLVMVWNDDLSWADEQKMPHISRPSAKLEQLFFTLGQIQRYRYQRPTPDYSGSVKEVLQLNNEVQKRGARLAVVLFRDLPESADSTAWGQARAQLSRTVKRGLQGTNIPILDFRDALFANHSWEDLLVFDSLDPHPNEIAHAIAAQEILKFLNEETLSRPDLSWRVRDSH